MIGRGASRQGSDDGSRQRDHLASGEERHMNNIFWLIGVIVVVLFVLAFLGLR
jgi:type VI protein secretion system component VasF